MWIMVGYGKKLNIENGLWTKVDMNWIFGLNVDKLNEEWLLEIG